ncbi:hypothetical protein C0991_000770 [Blastosporella zonata]|nr:hypothetical protein C0991_000770 [Blastosporella zonata]
MDTSTRPDSIFSQTSPDSPHLTNRRPRQAMTARESNAFNEMFSMIFDAAAAQDNSSIIDPMGKDGIDDLMSRLRKYPKRLKWSTEMDDILDRQKEVINLFTTDQELLEWATDAVFGESQRYEAAARKAISEATASGVKGELPMLQPPTYPHLVALIMQTFREKFSDPHLALSMFEHARNLSIASYVFGCSSQAYHQLIETRWTCFQDLKGVHDALQEMQVNGVKVSGQTRRFVEKLRREIGNKHLWVEESEVGSSEVWNILAQIERIALGPERRGGADKETAPSGGVKWDEWKAVDASEDSGFNQWDILPEQGPPGRRLARGRKKAGGEVEPFEEEMSSGEREPFGASAPSREREPFGEGGPVNGRDRTRGRRRPRTFGLRGD